MEYFGIDLHQKHSAVCGLSARGEVRCRRRVPTSEAGLRQIFGRRRPCRVVVESCCQTSWAARLLREMGHEVVVVNSRRVRFQIWVL